MSRPAPSVSVVIATYNMAQYLGQAISSVLAQTYGCPDVHVVDDGSTDETAAVVARWAAEPRVHYHRQPTRSGQPAAKNRGIRESRGELVGFCDADDYWLPDKLLHQIPVFDESESIGVVYGRELVLREDSQTIQPAGKNRCPSGRVTRELFVRNFVGFGSAVVRRRCLDDVGAFDERFQMSIDWELWLRISTRYEFRFVDAADCVYRVWPGQMSKDWRGRYEHCMRIMRDFAAAHPDVIDHETLRLAWAHTYTSRARYRSRHSGQHWHGILDTLRALSWLPSYWPAWRATGRVLLNAVTRSA